MAGGIDVLNAFPNSKMAKAAGLGQSRFMQGNEYVETGTFSGGSASEAPIFTPSGGGPPSAQEGTTFTLNAAGTFNTAALLTAAGFATQFNSISVGVQKSSAGVVVAQGKTGNQITLFSGGVTTLPGPITPTQNSVSITLNAGDTVSITAQGV